MIQAAEKVAIVGKAPNTRDQAPFDDESWEIWTLSDLVSRGQAPRYTRHFEVHPLAWLAERTDDYFDWLKQITDAPVYVRTQEEADQLPSGVVLPSAQLVAKYGRYFTNTVSWMLAAAIESGAKEIGVFGVDMAQTLEYRSQRPSCEYFLGWARGAGIKVHVPARSDLLKCVRLYGIDPDGREMREKSNARKEELKRRIANHDQQFEHHKTQSIFLQGALESHAYHETYMTEPWDELVEPSKP